MLERYKSVQAADKLLMALMKEQQVTRETLEDAINRVNALKERYPKLPRASAEGLDEAIAAMRRQMMVPPQKH